MDHAERHEGAEGILRLKEGAARRMSHLTPKPVGRLNEQDHRLLALWEAESAEHVPRASLRTTPTTTILADRLRPGVAAVVQATPPSAVDTSLAIARQTDP